MSKKSSVGVQAWYTNCPVYHAGNVDQELGWIEEEYKKLGAKFTYFRSTKENTWYPHYIHNMDNFFRYGGCCPAIHVKADIKDTVLLGLQWLHQGGAILTRSRDDIFTMQELKGKRIGISKSLNTKKNDWWRITEHRGIELALRLNGMTNEDVQWVEYAYDDDWYDKREMLDETFDTPSDIWLARDITNDPAFRPLELALENGEIDAIYTADGMYQVQEQSGKFKVIENLANYPDWTVQVANAPYTITVDRKFADEHPELIVAYMKGTIKTGRWINENKHAASYFLNKTFFHPTVKETAESIAHMNFVPDFTPMNVQALDIQKEFMLKHGYIKNDFDVNDWIDSEFAKEAKKLLAEEQKGEFL